MKEKMKNLVITEYCSQDKRKFRFIKEIKEDPLICHFVSNSMDEWLEDSENTEKVLVGPAYIIADERKLVGFIRFALLDLDGTLNLHYGVHPDYRKKHYGTKILEETKNYIFENMSKVNKIELYINYMNAGSIKCALNSGYKYEREFSSPLEKSTYKVYACKRS